MFSHTTIRHSYDFSQQIHQMAIEANQPHRDEDSNNGNTFASARNEREGQRKNLLIDRVAKVFNWQR